MQCRKGDTVYYPKHSSFTIELDDEDYIVIREGDIYAILPQKERVESKKELLTDSTQLKIEV